MHTELPGKSEFEFIFINSIVDSLNRLFFLRHFLYILWKNSCFFGKNVIKFRLRYYCPFYPFFRVF